MPPRPTRTRGKSPARQATEEARRTRAATKQSSAKPRPQKSAKQIAQAKDRKAVREANKEARAQRYKELQELRTRAVQAGLVEHGLNPTEVLQRLIDDAFIAYALAQTDYDAYVTGEEPDPKVTQKMESKLRSLRRETAYFAGLSVQYNLQERQTRVQEARVGLMVSLLTRVLRHPDIGLSQEKIAKVPQLMRENLAQLRQENSNA